MSLARNRSRGVVAKKGLLPKTEGAGIWARRSSLRRRQARFSRFTFSSGKAAVVQVGH